MREIERRFLCAHPPPTLLAAADRSRRIVQGYLGAGEPSVRIRRIDGDHILSVKRGSGLVRGEIEVPVEPAAGGELLEWAGEHRVEKTRHVLGRWEVDVYAGKLEGLVVAEVELQDEAEPLPPPPPGLPLRREVTEVSGYTAHAFALMSEAEARRFVRETLRELAS